MVESQLLKKKVHACIGAAYNNPLPAIAPIAPAAVISDEQWAVRAALIAKRAEDRSIANGIILENIGYENLNVIMAPGAGGAAPTQYDTLYEKWNAIRVHFNPNYAMLMPLRLNELQQFRWNTPWVDLEKKRYVQIQLRYAAVGDPKFTLYLVDHTCY